jgi:regulator of replication initiation timing
MEMIQVYKGEVMLTTEATNKIAELERTIAELRKIQDDVKKAIIEEMEQKGVVKLDNDVVTITYIAPTDRETFDSKKFKEEQPDMYDEYVKISPVKPSVRIKVK